MGEWEEERGETTTDAKKKKTTNLTVAESLIHLMLI